MVILRVQILDLVKKFMLISPLIIGVFFPLSIGIMVEPKKRRGSRIRTVVFPNNPMTLACRCGSHEQLNYAK